MKILSKKDLWIVGTKSFGTLKEACQYAEHIGAKEVTIQFTPFTSRVFTVGSEFYQKLVA